MPITRDAQYWSFADLWNADIYKLILAVTSEDKILSYFVDHQISSVFVYCFYIDNISAVHSGIFIATHFYLPTL